MLLTSTIAAAQVCAKASPAMPEGLAAGRAAGLHENSEIWHLGRAQFARLTAKQADRERTYLTSDQGGSIMTE